MAEPYVDAEHVVTTVTNQRTGETKLVYGTPDEVSDQLVQLMEGDRDWRQMDIPRPTAPNRDYARAIVPETERDETVEAAKRYREAHPPAEAPSRGGVMERPPPEMWKGSPWEEVPFHQDELRDLSPDITKDNPWKVSPEELFYYRRRLMNPAPEGSGVTQAPGDSRPIRRRATREV